MIEYVVTKSILSKAKDAKNMWFAYDYTMNLYRGCHHGCIYCDSRSSVYQVENFDIVKPKQNALEILENELRKKKKKGVIGMGAMSDPYNKLEADLTLTRNALELIDKYGFGVCITTKSDLLLRDIDILKRISSHSPVLINVTITIFDDKLAKVFERNVTSSSKRFEMLRILRMNNIYSGIVVLPILPYVNDNLDNISLILNKAKDINVKFVYIGFMFTQRDIQKEHYFNWLKRINTNLYLLHRKEFANEFYCKSKRSKELESYYESYCNEHKLLYKLKDINIDYKKNYCSEQIALF